MHITGKGQCTVCPAADTCGFGVLPQKAREELNRNTRCEAYRRGESLFHAGDRANYFYSIQSGAVQLYRSNANREQSFSFLTDGDWVGHRDAFLGGEYNHSARCVRDTRICRLPAEVLNKLMREYPEFAANYSRLLATSWMEQENQSYNLGSRRITERMADYLLGLKPANEAHTEGETVEVDFQLTREMVASYIGTSTGSVVRTLSDIKASDWVDLGKARVAIKNERELERLVMES